MKEWVIIHLNKNSVKKNLWKTIHVNEMQLRKQV